MGNATLTQTDRSYLYTNPASLLHQDDESFTISASGLMHLLPESEQLVGNLLYGAVSTGYRFLDRHAVYAGFRYQGGLGIKGGISDQWGEGKKSTTPFDWVIDLGYAFRITDALSAYASGGLIQSYTGRVAYAGTFTLGANYLFTFTDAFDLNLNARVADFGSPIRFSDEEAYALPTSLQMTADVGYAFSDDHKLRAVLGEKYYFLTPRSRVLQLNFGAEYTLFDIASLRAGMQYGWSDTSLWTIGLGTEYFGVKLDFAYLGALSEYGSDRLMLSLSFDY